MACCAIGRAPISASKGTRATRCSGIRSPRSPSRCSPHCPSAVSARLKLAAVVAVCAAPFVLGWLAYEHHWFSGQSGNYGELIAPRPLGGALVPLRGQWVFVTVDAAACAAACERKLYVVRPGRRGQGQESGRIERVWVVAVRRQPRAGRVAAF